MSFIVGHYLRQARRTDLAPWRQFHNLPEVRGHGSSCTLPGPCAITETQADMTQTAQTRLWMNDKCFIFTYRTSFSFFFSAFDWHPVKQTLESFGWSRVNWRQLTVPDRMSCGQQFRRWLLQTRSSVNLTLCRVSSPETVQENNQWERPHIFVSRGEVSSALIYTLLQMHYSHWADMCQYNCIQGCRAHLNESNPIPKFLTKVLYVTYLPVKE